MAARWAANEGWRNLRARRRGEKVVASRGETAASGFEDACSKQHDRRTRREQEEQSDTRIQSTWARVTAIGEQVGDVKEHVAALRLDIDNLVMRPQNEREGAADKPNHTQAATGEVRFFAESQDRKGVNRKAA